MKNVSIILYLITSTLILYYYNSINFLIIILSLSVLIVSFSNLLRRYPDLPINFNLFGSLISNFGINRFLLFCFVFIGATTIEYLEVLDLKEVHFFNFIFCYLILLINLTTETLDSSFEV